jgi:murein DD-endopeptidase MepM/ murein hydrolase activator NlpD
MRSPALTSIALIVLVCAACAELEQKQWYQTSRDVAATTVGKVSSVTSKAAARMQNYLSRKDVLEKFQDASEHSEDAVLSVLRKAGVGKTRTASTSTTASTGKVGAGATGGKATTGSTTTGAKAGSTVPKAPVKVADNKFPENYQGSYRWPLDAGIVSSEYGARWGKMHKGLDIAADVGEPVYAAAAGEVIYSGNGMSGYGNAVIVRHDNQSTSLYAHNSMLKVKVGQKVAQGEEIALLGSTGHSTGPHVHFEIRSGDATVSPRSVLPKSMNAALLPESLTLDGRQLFAGVLPMNNTLL